MPRKPMISVVAPAIGLGVALLAVLAPVAQPREEEVHDLRQVQTTTAAAANALPIRSASAAQTATWCGAPTPVDLAPNVVAGHPVHWVYAIPSDGADRLGTVASQMQTDSEDDRRVVAARGSGPDPAQRPRAALVRRSARRVVDPDAALGGPARRRRGALPLDRRGARRPRASTRTSRSTSSTTTGRSPKPTSAGRAASSPVRFRRGDRVRAGLPRRLDGARRSPRAPAHARGGAGRGAAQLPGSGRRPHMRQRGRRDVPVHLRRDAALGAAPRPRPRRLLRPRRGLLRLAGRAVARPAGPPVAVHRRRSPGRAR